MLGATWAMFDLDNGIWTKPSAHTKQRKLHRVPLRAMQSACFMKSLKPRKCQSALNIDPRHGGDDALAELEAKHGALPPTWRFLTGGGGEYMLFCHPGGVVKNSAPGSRRESMCAATAAISWPHPRFT